MTGSNFHEEPARSRAGGGAVKAERVRALTAAALVALLCCGLCAPAGAAQDARAGGSQGQTPSPTAERRAAPGAPDARKGEASLKASIPDVEVLNQDGKRIRFYSDLIEGKVFVVSFLFTTCTVVCPMQGQSLAKIQQLLGERLGREVNLISISTDPAGDTPARLKAWGARFGARPGWTFVTGGEAEVGKLAEAFTGSATYRGEHSPVVFVGGDHKGSWVRAYGLSGPALTAELIDEMSGGRTAAPGKR